ncbi:MAG: AMP-binding protein [Nitrospirae bacterium]|nr:AMP-binding protein [Nitrospirota bacterium]
MTNSTIISLFLSASEKYEDKAAFYYFAGSWRELTYRDFVGKTQAIAAHLIKSGIEKGDRVAIVAENRYEWCASYLGILMAGGIAVPVDAQLGSNEITTLLHDSGAVLVFAGEKTVHNVGDSARKIDFDSPEFNEICAFDSSPEGSVAPPVKGNERALSREDVASIVYTSGTTGTPKGVMLTHGNFCSDAEAVISAGLVTHQDNVLSILPLHHTYPFTCTFLVPLFLGASITYPPGMKGPELMATIKEKGVTVLVAVPQILELLKNGIFRKIREMPAPISALLLFLLKTGGALRRRTGVNIGSLVFRSVHRGFGAQFRFFASGGARLEPGVMRDLESLGFTVLEGYGLTETSPVVTFNPVEKRKPGSVGRPLPSAEIRILNPSETGEGEIAIRGPMVMKGYYKNPEATAAVMRNAWFLTGDLGHLDSEGYLFITGRVKEVIVLDSGKNVYPEDVEREYGRIPLIKELCVTGTGKRGAAGSLHGIIVPDLDYARKEKIGNIHDALKWDINKVSVTLPPFMRLKGFTLHAEPLPRTRLGKLKRYRISEIPAGSAGVKAAEKKEDMALLADETGRKVAECIIPLLRERTSVVSSDNLELDLGLDSLQRIELVVAIEKAFSLKLPETFASEVQTVGELVGKVKELRSAGGQKLLPGEEVSGEDIAEEDKKRVGLQQGKIEWGITVFLRAILRLLLKTLFRMKVKGIETLPEPPFIIAANHRSNMDGFVVGTAIPSSVFRVLYFQGFRTYFTGGRLPSLFGRLAHAIPIDPETFLSRAFRISSYVLRNNGILCIFPEGGRSLDGNLMEFKKGIGTLAVRHNAPVVPALIEGTFEALPRGARLPRLGPVMITFGKPFYPSELDFTLKPEGIDEYQFFANEVRERVKRLKGRDASL